MHLGVREDVLHQHEVDGGLAVCLLDLDRLGVGFRLVPQPARRAAGHPRVGAVVGGGRRGDGGHPVPPVRQGDAPPAARLREKKIFQKVCCILKFSLTEGRRRHTANTRSVARTPGSRTPAPSGFSAPTCRPTPPLGSAEQQRPTLRIVVGGRHLDVGAGMVRKIFFSNNFFHKKYNFFTIIQCCVIILYSLVRQTQNLFFKLLLLFVNYNFFCIFDLYY